MFTMIKIVGLILLRVYERKKILLYLHTYKLFQDFYVVIFINKNKVTRPRSCQPCLLITTVKALKFELLKDM